MLIEIRKREAKSKYGRTRAVPHITERDVGNGGIGVLPRYCAAGALGEESVIASGNSGLEQGFPRHVR